MVPEFHQKRSLPNIDAKKLLRKGEEQMKS